MMSGLIQQAQSGDTGRALIFIKCTHVICHKNYASHIILINATRVTLINASAAWQICTEIFVRSIIQLLFYIIGKVSHPITVLKNKTCKVT